MEAEEPPMDPHLDAYRAKRRFGRTPEPAGMSAGPDPGGTRRFVVQRHRARRTHYDFRLEVDGVLASWAMPRGPSLDPGVRALAVHVEDHPLEYRDFEGVIPAGEYGGGDVIVWDRGTWTPSGTDDPAAAIADGELHFDVSGEKLEGRFVLVRTRVEQGREQWLMLHKRDDAAVEGWSPDQHPRSVKSGLTNEQVKAAPASEWHSDRPPEQAEVALVGQPAPLPSWDVPSPAELDELDRMGAGGGVWGLQGRELKLTNLDKVLFPARAGEQPVTKRDLIRYYTSVGPRMLPFLYDRPVNLHRYPDGVDRAGFWHKQVPEYAPVWIRRWRYADAGGGNSDCYFVIDSIPALAWMANFGAVELHPWTSRTVDVHRPTWALVDIDPGSETTPQQLLVLARLYRTGLDHLGVVGAPKLSGQRGIHIWIPVSPLYTFAETSAWVEKLSRAVGATAPDLVSWTWQKSSRGGLARLDYTQNAVNKTLAAPYSVRPSPGAPVSVPVAWEALDDPDLRSDSRTVHDAVERMGPADDDFAALLLRPQRLPEL